MKKFFTVLISLAYFFTVQAQWTSDPGQNTLLSKGDTTYAYGEFRMNPQDSAYYHLYYYKVDDPAINYVIYLQKYDFNGVKQWADKGVLISNGPSMIWVPGVELVFNQDSCIYLAYSRLEPPGGSGDSLLHMRLNKVTNQGVKLWGDEGIDISDPENFGDYGPHLMVASDNNVVISFDVSFLDESLEFLDSYKTRVAKYAPDGSLLWAHTIPQNPGNMDWGSRLLELDDNKTMIVYKHDTIFKDPDTAAYWYDQSLRSWQYDADGSPVFDRPKHIFKYPLLLSDLWINPINCRKDKNGGVYVAANYFENYVFKTFIQYIDENSDTVWPKPVTVSADELMNTDRGSFSMEYIDESDELLIFWIEKVLEQESSRNSIMGQKINKDGQRIWGENGKLFHPIVSMMDTIFGWPVVKLLSDGHALFCYMEYVSAEAMVYIRAEKFDYDGMMVWPAQTMVSNRPDLKNALRVSDEINEQCVAIWELDLHEMHNENSILYGQNIKSDGQIGTWIAESDMAGFIELYPNPVSNKASVKIKLHGKNSLKDASISIYDVQGKMVGSFNVSALQLHDSEIELPLQGIQEGLYLVYIKTPDVITACKLLVY